MKKSMVIGLAIGLVSLAATAVFAADNRPTSAKDGALPTQGYAGAKNVGGDGIIGSSHDMGNVGTSGAGAAATAIIVGTAPDAQGRICVFCHHPHNAMAAVGQQGNTDAKLTYSPLWNRMMSTKTFTGYNNGIMMGAAAVGAASDKRHALNAADNGGTHITGVSLLCMSCHDGAVAMSAYSVGTGSTDNAGSASAGNPIAAAATSSFDSDMNNHHPMGFQYQGVQAADQEIASTSTVMVPANGTTIGDLLYGATRTMECVTCHDVHNTANQPGAERFLWRSDNKSNFCLTCHLK